MIEQPVRETLPSVDTYLQARMRDMHLPGLAVGIVRGNEMVYLRGFGTADPTGRPVTPHTPFILGSLSKSFTALAIMQLVEAGKLDLDASVQCALPWFRVADPHASAQITVRHLLTHMSGISCYTGRELLAGNGRGTMEQRVRELSTVALTKPVGTTFQYSNTNYLVLGLVIQVVSGQPFEEYIQQHIFAPLHMQHSFTSEDDARRDSAATGYRWWFGSPFAANVPYLADALPAAFLLSSAEDMAHYLIAHLNNGRYGEAAILSSEGMAELHRPEARTASAGEFYCKGWRKLFLGGVPVLLHGGEVANFRSEMVLLPKTGWGIVVLANANNGLVAQLGLDQIAPGIVNLLRGQSPPTSKFTFKAFYRIVDLVAVLLSVLCLHALLTQFQRWCHPQRRSRVSLMRQMFPLAWELMLPLGVLKYLPRNVDAPWRMLCLYVPDITSWLSGMFALLSVAGVTRIICAFLRRKAAD